MSDNDHNLVEIDPEKLGGTPVFRGTRVPIQNLYDSLESGESVEQFLEQYPTVSREQLIAVLEESKEKFATGCRSPRVSKGVTLKHIVTHA